LVKKIEQVDDNLELLDLMMQDMEKVSDFYKPTNFWSIYEKKFLPELKKLGLKDFQRRKKSVLTSFHGTDMVPSLVNLNKFPKEEGPFRVFMYFVFRQSLKWKKMQRYIDSVTSLNSGVSNNDLNFLCYQLAKFYGESRGAKSINNFEISNVGNPENVFYVKDKMYTFWSLSYYAQYAYCSKFMNFDSINSIMELGSGAGKQTEVLKKLYPNITFYLFDIAPQLYVCEQYLSKVFPGDVITYEETRNLKKIPEDQTGKIFIFGSWKIAELSNFSCDLFWNAASLQEMEPEIVLNYLNYINGFTRKYVFLDELMKGQKLAPAKGQRGVLEQTKLEHYKKGLKDFQLIDESDVILRGTRKPSPPYLESFSFWKRIDN